MRIMLCTLALNEEEWLPALWKQHQHWPDMVSWVFVESADAVYAKSNPDMVSETGLSIDGTSNYLRNLAARDSRVRYIPHGFCRSDNPAQGKCEARQQYIQAARNVRPDFIYVLDSDEFYTNDAQKHINNLMQLSNPTTTAFCFKQRHIWRPPSIADQPLSQYEVVGGFWSIPHCRGWRYFSNMEYTVNHNTPYVNGVGLDTGIKRYDQIDGTPECVHYGFAASLKSRVAKHRYYADRGESVDPKRQWYVRSRAEFETWKPGDVLPRDAKVIPFTGVIPEVFQ